MIYLTSIELLKFKGIDRLTCEFDDFTVLAGLNNSGKTSILQAVYLLHASLPRIASHQHFMHADRNVRMMSFDSELSPLGLRDHTWLRSFRDPEVDGTIIGEFSNTLRVQIDLVRNSPTTFVYTASQKAYASARSVLELVREMASCSASILMPPGDVPSREAMLTGQQYQHELRQGKGSQYWRNGIFWGVQEHGVESFKPVQDKLAEYFPDITLLIPTLSIDGQPEIQIKYQENGQGSLDIAQSGAGLRTFLSLSRILEQSPARVLLFDEPDAHLHASQQKVILDLMMDASAASERQVIIATHSPELICRVPPECLRWVDRIQAKVEGGLEVSRILEELGATAEIYFSRAKLPDVLVYVEGVEDKPIVEELIKWCRKTAVGPLPTTAVISHKDGRFDGPTLQSIVRFARGINHSLSVVGVRDRDWYYHELPSESLEIDKGDGWSLITLPCKEMENLFCNPSILFQVFGGKLNEDEIRQLLNEESANPDLTSTWRYQVLHRIRGRLPQSQDLSTKERHAEEIFANWSNNPETRARLISGKSLLRRIRQRVRQSHGIVFYPNRIPEKLQKLSPPLLEICRLIFPMGNLT